MTFEETIREIHRIMEERDQLKEALEDCGELVDDLNQGRKTLIGQIDAAASTISGLRREISGLKQENEAACALISKAQQESSELKAALKEAKGE